MDVSSVSGDPLTALLSKSAGSASNVIAGYQTPVVIRMKKEPRVSLIERERTLNAFDRRMAIKEVDRALNAWYYQSAAE